MSGFLVGLAIVGALFAVGCFAAVAAVVLGAQAERREERRQAAARPADGPPLTAYEREVLGQLDERGED